MKFSCVQHRIFRHKIRNNYGTLNTRLAIDSNVFGYLIFWVVLPHLLKLEHFNTAGNDTNMNKNWYHSDLTYSDIKYSSCLFQHCFWLPGPVSAAYLL